MGRTDFSDEWTIQGIIDNAEDIYYSDYIFGRNYAYTAPANYDSCPNANYRNYYDHDLPNLSRWQFRQRIKFIVDDEN